MAILSSDTLGIQARLQAMGVAHLADPIIDSARLSLHKPDPRIYHHALSILDVPAATVLCADDKPSNTLVACGLSIECADFTLAADLATALRRYGLLPVRRHRLRMGAIVQRACWIGMVAHIGPEP